MALSQQDLFVQALIGNSGFFVDIGAGNGEGEPCASNTAWLEELGWTGILLEYRKDYHEESKVFRPKSISVWENAFSVDFLNLFKINNAPKVIDYLTIDIDPTEEIQSPCVQALSRFPFFEYDFKILTIEHDLYNPHGDYQKKSLMDFMKNKPYKLIAENVALSFAGTKYLEDWYINPKFYSEFKVNGIESLSYKNQNPNDIIIDLLKRVK
jgi:hypothetical protein